MAKEASVVVVSTPRPVSFEEAWYRYATEDHFWIRWRARAFLAQVRRLGLPADAPWEVLDIGAGRGILRDQIEAETAWNVSCADLNLEALENVRPGRGRRLCYDVLEERPELAGTFDAVLLFDVLEHIEQTRPFLAALIRHLKPGGRLFVNVPALQPLYSAYDAVMGHWRRYERASLAAEFSGLPFEVQDVRYWGFSMLPLLALRTRLMRGKRPDPALVEKGFRPPGRLANALLSGIARAETALFPRPPLGTSVLLAGRRTDGR